ncbi:MAG: alpha-E domain-containing protein, partial [Acidimicrobiia bacterium]
VLSRLDQPLDEHGAEQVLNGLLDALWALTAGGPGPAGPASGRALAAILDPARPASLVATLRTLVDAAFAVQEQLSGDTWQVLADVESSLAALESQPPELLLAVQPDLAGLTRALLALAGLAVESMVRDAAWCFLDGGRRVERALALATVLRVTLVPVRPPHVEALLGESVLRAFESIIDYRRRFHATAQARLIAEQLVFDAENPRSLRWQLDRLADDLAALPRRDGRRLNPEERPVLDARTTVSLVDPASLFGPDDGPAERRGALDGFLARLAGLLEEATSELDRAYFVAPSRAALAQTSNTGRSPA